MKKLGFKVFAGDASQNWLILKNGDHAIGLFQGMFEKNTLTFNPGRDSNAQRLDTFIDVRDLQRQLKAKSVAFQIEADENINRSCELYGHRSRLQSHSGRSARVSPNHKLTIPRSTSTAYPRFNVA